MKPSAQLAGILTVLALAGCIGTPTQPSSFYVLSVVEGAPVTTAQPLSLGVGPLSLPEVLDRPQIVTRPDPNRIDLSEYHRWGGELGRDLGRVLAQDLMQRLATDNVVLYPWHGSSRPARGVSIDFFRFDGVPGQSVHLQGSWRLLDTQQDCQLALYRFAIEEPAQGVDYQALVSAMSRGVGRLSDDIARVIAKPGGECAH
jgi:uncharacterized lipoprotein YmbA